jgi:hypothetical protein
MMLMVSPSRCQHCSQEMRAARQLGRRRRFCSNACRQAEFRNRRPAPETQLELPLRNEAPKAPEDRSESMPPTDPESRLAYYRAQIPTDLGIPKFMLRIGNP